MMLLRRVGNPGETEVDVSRPLVFTFNLFLIWCLVQTLAVCPEQIEHPAPLGKDRNRQRRWGREG